MYYFMIYLTLSAIGIGCSFPIAFENQIPVEFIFYDYFSFLTYCGVCCGFLLLSRPVTKRYFDPCSKLWRVSESEQRFYRAIKLQSWKKIVPDFGRFVGFQKNMQDKDIHNSEFYKRFIYETVNASFLHGVDILLAPLFFLFLHREFYLTIGLTCLAIVFILNILPVMVQRYNRPRLIKMYLLTKRQTAWVSAEKEPD